MKKNKRKNKKQQEAAEKQEEAPEKQEEIPEKQEEEPEKQEETLENQEEVPEKEGSPTPTVRAGGKAHGSSSQNREPVELVSRKAGCEVTRGRENRKARRADVSKDATRMDFGVVPATRAPCTP